MAQQIILSSGSPLIGSPITVKVTPDSHQSQWTFHRVLLRVYAKLVVPDTSDPNYIAGTGDTEMEFSTPVETKGSGSSMTTLDATFDISSALRAVADRYEPTDTPPSQYPYVKFRVVAWDEYMVDGGIYTGNEVLLPGTASGEEPDPGPDPGPDPDPDPEPQPEPQPSGDNLLTGLTDGTGWDGYIGGAGLGYGVVMPDGEGNIMVVDAEKLATPVMTLQSNTQYTLSLYLSTTDFSVIPNTITALIYYDNEEYWEDSITLNKVSVSGTRIYYTATFNTGTLVENSVRLLLEADIMIYSPLLKLYSSTRRSAARSVESESQRNLYYYAFRGAFSDFERLISATGFRTLTKWTRKPTTSPEVVFCGEKLVLPTEYPKALDSDYADPDTGEFVDNHPVGGPASHSYNIPATEGSYYIREGVIVYAIQKPEDGYVVRFQNGLGCLESLHLRCLPKKTVPINTEKYVISRQETFGQFSRGLAVKSGDREEWRMTSGPLDEAWASWYIHEFLKAEACWIATTYHPTPNTSQVVWLPVHVIPEETVTLIDRQKTDPYEVQFTLQMDIEGSPMSALAI